MRTVKIKKKKVRVILKLIPTPFLPKTNKTIRKGKTHTYDERIVRMFYLWLYQESKKLGGFPIANFVLARDLKIHRCVVDDWDVALRMGNYTLLPPSRARPVDMITIRNPYPDDLRWLDKHELILKTVNYNPWVDRSWDRKFYDLWYPYAIDTFVDKYYSVFLDEHFIWFRVVRRLSNGNIFRPIKDGRTDSGHPISEVGVKASKRNLWRKDGKGVRAPTLKRRDKIYNLCQGQGGVRTRASRKKIKTLKDWKISSQISSCMSKIKDKPKTGSRRRSKNKPS